MQIEFDEVNHEYRIRQQEGNPWVSVPSVTQILKGNGLSKGLEWATQEHRDRGTYIHKMIAKFERGELDESDNCPNPLTPEARAYLEQWKRFKTESGDTETLLSEHQVMNWDCKYAGTLDLLIRMNRTVFLIDIKTGSPQPADKLQTVLYQLAYEAMQSHIPDPIHRACVYLKPDGYKMERFCEFFDDQDAALSAVNVYHFKKRYNLLDVEL
jgi:hypothetical protein